MDKTICYCFNYSEADIKNDFMRNSGRSLILEKIAEEKQRGGCHCKTEHPQGR